MKNENPNTNCLDGFQCPSCGSYGPFRIYVTISGPAMIYDQGSDDCVGDAVWDDASSCECRECGHIGKVRDFTGAPEPKFEPLQRIVALSYDDGEHSCRTPDDIPTCEDGLLTFLMVELSSKEGCDSPAEAISRIDSAIRQLEAVRVAIGDSMLSKWRVTVQEENGVPFLFECMAENSDHATEQAKDAYPGCTVIQLDQEA